MRNLVTILLTLLLSCTGAQAIPLAGQYSIASSASHISGDTWKFDYRITNINQSGPFAGLDGFAILAPSSASIVSWTDPAPFSGPPGYWAFIPNTDPVNFLSTFPTLGMLPPSGYQWLRWWGYRLESVYPAGSSADFSITLDHVTPGTNPGAITTYWWISTPSVPYDQIGGYYNYTTYTTSIVAPFAVSAVPEPMSIVLVLLALVVSLAVSRHKSLLSKRIDSLVS